MNNKPIDTWGIERNARIPVKIFASDDDLSSDGKLILCSKKKKLKDDVEYVCKQWVMETIKECLIEYPDILKKISERIETDSL